MESEHRRLKQTSVFTSERGKHIQRSVLWITGWGAVMFFAFAAVAWFTNEFQPFCTLASLGAVWAGAGTGMGIAYWRQNARERGAAVMSPDSERD